MFRHAAITFYDRQGRLIEPDRAQQLWHNLEYRILGFDRIAEGCTLVTSWTAFDVKPPADTGPPMIFETRVYGGPDDGRKIIYPSECGARQGHHRAVVQNLAGQRMWFLR